MFVAKKWLAALLMPLSLIGLLLLVGLLLLLAGRRRTGAGMVAMATLTLLLLASAPISERIVAPLEYRHPPIVDLGTVNHVSWIIVLGSGHTTTHDLPPNAELGRSALARLSEGVRLQQALPQATLLLSGGAVFDPVSNAHAMRRVAPLLGADMARLVVEERPRDTAEEARLIIERIGEQPFLLVTSASHMPRAMALFQGVGGQPIAAPTDYIVKHPVAGTDSHPGRWFPQPAHLADVQRAWHEYLGLLWSRLRGEL